MADRVLIISWGRPHPGREERGLEVFNEALGLCGRMQQDGRIESFDVVLLRPNPEMNGFIEVRGSADQIAAVERDEEFMRNTADALLVVEHLRHTVGYTGDGVSQQVALYQEAIGKLSAAVR
jgi:hypothetical protein